MNYSLLNDCQDSGLNLVKYIVEKDFENAKIRYGRDELVSVGVQGLMKSCKDYVEGFNFVNFACINIKREIINFLRRECHWDKKNKVSKKRVFSESELTSNLLPRSYSHNFEDTDNVEIIDLILNYINLLPEDYRKVIFIYYFKEITFDAISKQLNLPKSRLYKLMSLGLDSIRNKFYKETVL